MERETVHELTAAYALDALDHDDERAYEEHLGGCAPCRDELTGFQETASALAYAIPAPGPSPDLRARILQAAREERGGVVIPFPKRWAPRALAVGAAVAACAAIAFGLWAASLRDDLDNTRSALAEERAAAEILTDPQSRRADVAGAEGSLVVAPDGQAVLALRRIPRAPKGKDYEIWVIRGQTPKRAGLFEQAGAVRLDRRVPRGATVAVTLEQDGGVDAPTTQPRYTAQA